MSLREKPTKEDHRHERLIVDYAVVVALIMTFVLGLYFLYYFTKKNRLEKDFKNKKDSIRKEMIRSDSIKSKMKRDTVQYLD